MRCLRRPLISGVLAFGLATGGVFAASAADTGSDEIIAHVNGKPIKLSDVALADEEMGQALAQLPEQQRFQYLLSMLIDRRIVADAARAKKMQDDPMVKAREAYFDEKVLRDVYWVQLMRDKVSEAKVKAYYDANIAKAESETEAHAAHILVTSKAEAQKAIDSIKGGESFEAAAKKASKDSSAADGGDLGWFKKADMVPEFANAVFAMKKGEVSAPVETQFGWHVIKLIDTRKAPKPTFEEAQDEIMRSLVREQSNKVMEDLRKAAKVEIVGAAKAPASQMTPAP
ncbi:MAG: peptidylprolyl isomerase [Parvibaculum sp.]|nr:peptidylprolyl isomerase [Parvibaculum sp.]|tara:strand:- start:1755 stop:2612 length:858 start_codon:yes stop_codon:yes gene_type:complete